MVVDQHPNVIINGVQYSYLKDRLMGGKIYVSHDKRAYLRTHGTSEIAGELNITRELGERGFPVPRVLGNGSLPDGDAYFIEESVGTDTFGDMFMSETKKTGSVQESTFAAFTAIAERYCAAQFNPANYFPHDKNALAQMAQLSNVLRNNPPSAAMHDAFMTAYEKAAERLMGLPWGFVQADLNAFNMLPEGIIDFELAQFGTIGYDAVTSVYFGRMWPKERIAYRFSDEQISRYVAAIDGVAVKNGVPSISAYTDDFLVLKAIWGTALDKHSEENPGSNPAFWSWRIRVRDWCIQQYLDGNKIDTNHFEEVGASH